MVAAGTISRVQRMVDRVVSPETRSRFYGNVSEFFQDQPLIATFLLAIPSSSSQPSPSPSSPSPSYPPSSSPFSGSESLLSSSSQPSSLLVVWVLLYGYGLLAHGLWQDGYMDLCRPLRGRENLDFKMGRR
ncbi:98522e20-ba06-4329-b8ad-f3c3abfce5d3 [Sclerotinia trifoliorum]|uniref:98522e20-ba06-4329-b8ad-f3c3abfce5d3 n=1 Tax=Sclerotinia trifoliorum TaxID=28548 RepID=A0A8H2VQB2_9HELO|nr:98522e20-ba06-4329-b8ad-f3c3abfce5d3 [Sclerotinia trifoliorum]